ncbi:MAG: hypothetical protein AB9866_18915 [Syntrophobacteraceae bacterium]
MKNITVNLNKMTTQEYQQYQSIKLYQQTPEGKRARMMRNLKKGLQAHIQSPDYQGTDAPLKLLSRCNES